MPSNHRQAIKADYCLNQMNSVTRVVECPMELCNVYIPISKHSHFVKIMNIKRILHLIGNMQNKTQHFYTFIKDFIYLLIHKRL